MEVGRTLQVLEFRDLMSLCLQIRCPPQIGGHATWLANSGWNNTLPAVFRQRGFNRTLHPDDLPALGRFTLDKASGTSIHGTVPSSVENLLLIRLFFFFFQEEARSSVCWYKKSYSCIKSANRELGKLVKTAFSHGTWCLFFGNKRLKFRLIYFLH